MKRLLLTTLIALSAVANAIHQPVYPRPILGAAMEVTASWGMFNNAREVSLTLMRHGPTPGQKEDVYSIVLDFLLLDRLNSGDVIEVSKNLVVVNSYVDNCGSTVYDAQLSDVFTTGARAKVQQPHVGERFSVTLVDHSTRLCEDYRPYVWEAHVRSGYGWCGTMDSVMKIVGNPEPPYSIQTLR